jgi:hypothetical protein
MRKSFILLLLCLIALGCKREITTEELQLLNGYWEIEKVVFKEGKDKVYNANQSYDYFQLDTTKKGFRKKVMPQLNGTFLVNDTYENITIRNEDKLSFIDYTTPYATWSEEIISLSKENLVLRNDQNNDYYYKKAAPINILNNGKKTQ